MLEIMHRLTAQIENFIFIDININLVIKITKNNIHSAFKYFKLTDSSRHFSSFILKILINDRQAAHTSTLITPGMLPCLQANDIASVRRTSQSDLFKNKISKLCYAVRDPY